MSTQAAELAELSLPHTKEKWKQLGYGLLCMAAISSPQYVWTLLTRPMMSQFSVGLPQLQVTFSLLIILQTFFSPFQGKLIDYFGAKRLIAIGTLLSGFSWVLTAQVHSLTMLYLVYGCMGGLGTGIVYVGVVGLVVQWFPERRGFAAGMVAAGYGMGAIVTTFPVSMTLQTHGLNFTLTVFGLIFAGVGLLASQGLKRAPQALAPQKAVAAGDQKQFKALEMLRQPLFWLMFFMMTCMSTSGLMVTSQMAMFAKDFGISDVVVLGMAALPLALTIDRFTNGLTRPLFGFISDKFGREQTMFIAFALEAVAMTLWLMCRHDAVLFVLLSGVVFLGWGEIFSLFPATLTDTFGSRHATTNYGCLYMSQGIGSIVGGPLAALLYQHTQSWMPVFTSAISLDVLTAILALLALKPLRQRFLRRHTA